MKLAMICLCLITVVFVVILYQIGNRFRTYSDAARRAHSGHIRQYIPQMSFSLAYDGQVLPGPSSGLRFNGKDPYNTGISYDNPFLTFMFWVQISPLSTEDESIIVANREVECIRSMRGNGFVIYYDRKASHLVALWRAKENKCFSIVIANNVRAGVWMHVAAKMYTVDTNFDTEFDDDIYPMVVDFYVNGEKSVSASSLRFLTHDERNYMLGASPSGKNLFMGRIYYFMIIDYDVSDQIIKAVYHGDVSTVEKLKNHAAVVMGTNSVDISQSRFIVFYKHYN